MYAAWGLVQCTVVAVGMMGAAVALLALGHVVGWEPTWRAFGVTPPQPQFFDMHVINDYAACASRGVDAYSPHACMSTTSISHRRGCGWAFSALHRRITLVLAFRRDDRDDHDRDGAIASRALLVSGRNGAGNHPIASGSPTCGSPNARRRSAGKPRLPHRRSPTASASRYLHFQGS
jgi:hypothetical protein